jgi:hypothetical protein
MSLITRKPWEDKYETPFQSIEFNNTKNQFNLKAF